MISPLAGDGVTAAVHKWGHVMRDAYSVQRHPRGDQDIIGNSVGYWTDNGAVYDGRQPLSTNRMAELFAQLRQAKAPARYLQLDPYWYNGMHAWAPQPALYGAEGLRGLVSATNGTRLLLYHNFWDQDTQAYYASRGGNFSFVPGFRFLNWGQPRYIVQIHPEDSFAFFDFIFAEYMRQGVMVGAEVDFLSWSQVTVPAIFTVLDGGHEYLKGMAEAARKHGVSHQLCMGLPSHLMDSLALPAVTNARASPDNIPTDENRWLIGYTSLVMWALDVQPFADNVWTRAREPAQPYGHGVFRHNVELQVCSVSGVYYISLFPILISCFDTNIHLIRKYPFLQVLMSALSAGPLGIGDQIGLTNTTLLLHTCTANGTLLHPDKPATPIDAMFSALSPSRPPGEVWQTHTSINISAGGTLLWRYILGVDTHFTLRHEHLWPTDIFARDTVGLSWRARQQSCGERWNMSGVYELQTAPMSGLEHGFDLVTVAPIVWTRGGKGVSLIGEADKYVSVSRARFGQRMVVHSNGTLGLRLRGAPNESVCLVYVVFSHGGDEGACRREMFVLGDDGALDVLLG